MPTDTADDYMSTKIVIVFTDSDAVAFVAASNFIVGQAHDSSNSNNVNNGNDKEGFHKYLVMQSTNPDCPLSGMSHFVIDRGLRAENIHFS